MQVIPVFGSLDPRTCIRVVLLVTWLTSAGFHSSSRAGDWPQILGPTRNGQAQDEPVIAKWPEAGPPTAWSRPLGQGFAGPAVVGNRVVIFHRVDDVERLEAWDATTGQPLWQADFPASYRGGINPDLGPRCVPLVHQQRVFAFGAAGDLHCVDLADGKKIWSREAYRDYQGDEGYFGAGSTPIVVAEKVLVNVGGRTAGIVAFDVATGKTAWSATTEGASYSSPTAATIDGVEHVIFVTRLSTLSLDPQDGVVRFRFPFGSRGPTVNGATPLVFDKQLFVSSSYGVGATLSRITAKQAEQVWANDTSMSSQYSTCVYHDGFLYGTHGREDYANGELRCIEARTGRIAWSVPGFGVAHTILVGEQLVLLGIDGQLRLAEANPQAYRQVASAQVSDDVTRALPALANGRLYLRDNATSAGKLICLELAR